MSRPKTTMKQIDDWRKANSETEHLEFKEAKTQFRFETLLEYCVAMANEEGGVLLLGIANRPPRPVVGSNAFPNVTKTADDLFRRLRFRVDVEEAQHPDGRVVLFHIPSRPLGHPYHLDGAYLMRSGEATVPMSPDRLKQIFKEGSPNGRKAKLALGVVLFCLVFGSLAFLWTKYQASSRSRGTQQTKGSAINGSSAVEEPRVPSPASSDKLNMLPNPVSTSTAPTKKLHQVPLIFKASPSLTGLRKKNISQTVDGCYLYLRSLGFPVKNELPPIGVSQTNTFHGAGIYPGTVYDNDVFIPRNRIDDSGEISRIYADYVFADLFEVHNPSKPHFDERSVWVYSLYFASSYVGHPIADLKHPTSDVSGLLKSLWAVRERKGKDFTDRSLFFAYKRWIEPTVEDKDFRTFFRNRFLLGMDVVSNDLKDIQEINAIFDAAS